MRESKCACGQKCDHGKAGACTARRKLPDRFTKKKGKKTQAKHIPRAVLRHKLY